MFERLRDAVRGEVVVGGRGFVFHYERGYFRFINNEYLSQEPNRRFVVTIRRYD